MKTSVTLSSRSLKVTQHMCLNEHEIHINAMMPATKRAAVDHVFCCDISGSMWDDLPLMRRQLKNRISDIVRDDDTITIIAFAGSDRCFVLKEFVKCSSPEQLQMLQDAIDRFIRPGGCTDFVNPIVKTKELIDKGHNGLNWIFLSDGGHNESSFTNVINALNEIKTGIAGATIIEYGMYADSKRLSEMADLLGGAKVLAEGFESYEPKFEMAINGATGKPMIEVDLPEEVKNNASPTIAKAFYINPTTKLINAVLISNGTISIPEGVNKFYSFTSKDVSNTKSKKKDGWEEAEYAAVYILADMLQYTWAEKILALTGDKKFIEMYSNSFGKQKLFAFQNEILAAVFDPAVRGEIDKTYKASPANYCVVDFFNDLQEEVKGKENYILVVDPSFSYKRIGSATVAKSEGISKEDQEKLANAKTTAELKQIMEEKEKSHVDMKMINKGYPMNAFTWNETRANLSARVHIDVALTLPKNDFGLDKLDSQVWRNYNIVKDGLINTNIIPMLLTKETYDKIAAHKAVVFVDIDQSKETVAVPKGYVRCTVDISKLPVINVNRARGVKKGTMTKMETDLMELKYRLKYLGWKKKGLDKSYTTKNKWEDNDQNKWLESLGITSEGFNPPSQVVKNEEDYYNAIEFVTTIKSFGSIPKIEDVYTAIKDNKKMKPSLALLSAIMTDVDAELDKKVKAKMKKDKKAVEADVQAKAITEMFDELTKKKRELGNKVAQTKFSMIVARRWFNDCESFDDNADTAKNFAGVDMNIVYDFSEKKCYL